MKVLEIGTCEKRTNTIKNAYFVVEVTDPTMTIVFVCNAVCFLHIRRESHGARI